MRTQTLIGTGTENGVRSMALWRRKPGAGLIHHSDRGSQYTALSFGRRLQEAGIVPSMGRTGTALDNAMAESFIGTLKTELVHRRRFPDREVARSAIFEYLEGFYNRRRLHSALSYQGPMSYEESTMAAFKQEEEPRLPCHGSSIHRSAWKVEFSEVELPLYGILRRSLPQKWLPGIYIAPCATAIVALRSV
jgi:hypothetical protein